MMVNRYRIEGVLQTMTPLRVGSWEIDEGDRLRKSVPEGASQNLGREGETAEKVIPSAVALDCENKPCIPGSSIRGVLRARAEQLDDSGKYVKELFGFQENDTGLGGRLYFYDSRVFDGSNGIKKIFNQVGPELPNPLYWDENRLTCLFAGVSINRLFRTAEANKLFYHEVVPPGVSFQLEICGEGLSEGQLGFLLCLLDQFNIEDDFITLGADSVRGFGRMRWELKKVSGLTKENEYRKWIETSASGFDGMFHIGQDKWQVWKDVFNSGSSARKSPFITLGLELYFDGPFMVNDPSQVISTENKDVHNPDHIYLKNEKGKIILRSRSVHGALRAQAERIVRTISDLPNEDIHKVACFVESRNKGCAPLTEKDDKNNLCGTCRLFGGNGWKSPVFISDFTPKVGYEGKEYEQEFVGIDRFTGGASKKKKFKANYRFKPVLEGTLRIDTSRINQAHIGLTALLLRDLLEGDIFFGFGASKGFGKCFGKITSISLPDELPDCFLELMELGGNLNHLTDVSGELNDSQSMFIGFRIEELIDFIKEI